MPFTLGRRGAVVVSLLAALVAAFLLDRAAPFPSADVQKGSEDAFAEGLHPREIERGAVARRWSRPTLTLRFRNLPPGPATLQVRVAGHRGPVSVSAGGRELGQVAPGRFAGNYEIAEAPGGRLDVELRTEGWRPEGDSRDDRIFGTTLQRMTLVHARPRGLPPWPLVLALFGPALAVLLGGLAVGVRPGVACALALAVTGSEAAALLPFGIVRSGYGVVLAGLLTAGAVVAAGVARIAARRAPGPATPGWAFAALLAAVLVQGVAATHPCLVVSDAVFHAHNLKDVAAGDFFLTSVTPHERPFRFPYGVSFYVLLAPLLLAGPDEVALVRYGAAFSGVVASAGFLLWLAPSGPRRAGLAVVILQLLPVTFDLYSYGNFSNIFGQAVTVLFFCWWAGSAAGGGLAGAALLALACTAHLSSLVVLLALVPALAFARGAALGRDPRRLLALGVGLGLTALYYLQFRGLIVEQLPRLFEGGGRGGGAALPGSALGPLRAASLEWGPPAIVLAILGRPRPSHGPFDRDLAAFWVAGGILALVAVLTPLEVRYTYALTLPLAVAAAQGVERLVSAGRGRFLALALLGGQAYLALAGVWEGVLHRYRG